MAEVIGSRKERMQFSALMASLALAVPGLLCPGQAFAVDVGVAAAVNVDAFGTPPGAGRTAKVLGDDVIYNERIETDGDGLVQVLLRDGSTFTVGANSDLVIDEFVYDPNAGTGKLVVSFSKGVARFVGGKLSKNKGGVTVNTPVGTIGIRGGIANLNLTGNNPTFSLLFGKELTFRGNGGQNRRIFQPGYSLQLGTNGNPRIRRTLQSDLGGVQRALSSRSGQNGGIPRPPNDGNIANSGVPNANSDLGVVNTTPPPKPRTIRSANLQQRGQELRQFEQRLAQNATQQRFVKEVGGSDVVSGGLTSSSSEVTNVRILRAGSTFTPAFDMGLVISSPGNRGLAGGSSGVDQTVTFNEGTVVDGSARTLWVGTLGGTKIPIFEPASATMNYFSQVITDEDNVLQSYSASYVPQTPSVTPSVDGNIVANAQGVLVTGQDFAAFAYYPAVASGTSPAYNYGGTDVIYGLYGRMTDFTNFGSASSGTTVRKYKLFGDPLTSFQLGTAGTNGALSPLQSQALFVNPFVAEKLGAGFMSGVSATGLLVLEASPTTLNGADLLAASAYISGSGSSQKSLVSIGLGYVHNSNDEPEIALERRGGHRWSAGEFAGRYGGNILSLEGADGGYFFSENAANFVLSSDLKNDSAFSDTYVNLPSGTTSADNVGNTFHVGELSGETAVSSLSRSTMTYHGFASAMVESTAYHNAEIDGNAIGFASVDPNNVTLSFNSSANTVTGEFTVADTRDRDSMVYAHTVAFGTGGTNGESTFIDNDTYAARESTSASAFYVTAQDEYTTVTHTSSPAPGGYLIPSTVVGNGDASLFAGKNECTCAFLEWGYWGASLSYNDSMIDSGGARNDTVHLGTWVAGDVTNLADLPTSGSATYTGHAVGNVVNGTDNYLAAGNFGMTVNFGTQTASAAVTGFDGRSFGSSMTASAVSGGRNLFSGSVTGTGMSGDFKASLVRGPSTNHDGAIGNFNVINGSWAASGIVAGQRQ